MKQKKRNNISSLNLSELVAFNSNLEILQRFRNRYLRIIVNAPWQRYADRMEEHPNIFAINEKSQNDTPVKKKITSSYVPDRIVIYRAYIAGHMLFKTFINCQMYY